jgi:PAS domain S-box-containing protein
LKRKKTAALRKFGLELVGNVPWGTHLCQFYETKEDLVNVLVPYFSEGLRNNEFCMWITSPPLEAEEAKQALKKSVPELDQYIQKGQIEILPYTEWYLLGGSFNSDRVLRDWVKKEKAALDSGFDGLRLTGNTFWLERNGWKAFTEYEEEVNNVIGKHRMIAVCTYCLGKCNANEVIDVVKNHQFALIKRSGKWERIESAETKKVRQAEEDLRSAALFPEQNPSAVLRVARDGTLLYANRSSAPLLDLWKCQNTQRVPEQICQQVTQALTTQQITQHEVTYDSITYSLEIVPIVQYDYANIYGSDITERKKAEDAIHILNERFEMAQRAAGVGVWDWNTKSGHIEWTPEMFRLFGLDPQKAIASFEAWTAVLHPEDREKAAAKIDQALKTHSFLNNEYRVVRPDGKIIWINALGQGEYDDQNQPIRMSGICMDITERKKAEKALHERENDLNRAQAVAKTGSWRLDVRRNQLLWSDETYRMFGIPKRTPLTYEAFLSTIHPDDRKYVDQKWKQALRGASYDIEHRIVVDGKVKWVREKAELELDKDGTMLGGFGTVQDITERKEMQNKLEEYSKNLEKLVEERTKKLELSALHARSLIEASLDPLVTINIEGKITDVNKATELATGCSREQLIGSDFSDYFTEPEKARTGYKKVFAEGFVRDYPLAIRSKSGKTIDVLYNAAIYRNAQGEIQGVFAAARDITELKKAEEKAQESAKKLKDAERLAAIGATAGMVGHDMRNPLQSILGDVYLAKMDLASLPDSEEKEGLQESLEAIEKQTEYINKIVLDLQDFAKPLNPHAEETDIEIIINELLTKNGVPKNIQTDAKVEADAKKMMADSAYIKRILGNLVSNAVQAMPNGGKLTLRAYREASDIAITVEDTGVGIPEEAKPKLFQPLFTTKSKGQGFGLSVAKRLTEALNGTITFESQEGKGTKFALRFSLSNKKQIAPK